MYHSDHLRIFCSCKRYLCLDDEEPLVVTRNLRFRKIKIEIIQLHVRYIYSTA